MGDYTGWKSLHTQWITNRMKVLSLQWPYSERDGVSNHRSLDCLLNRLFRRRRMKASKLRVTGLSEGNSSVTGEFPLQRARNAENVPFDDVMMWDSDSLSHHCSFNSPHRVFIMRVFLGGWVGVGVVVIKIYVLYSLPPENEVVVI